MILGRLYRDIHRMGNPALIEAFITQKLAIFILFTMVSYTFGHPIITQSRTFQHRMVAVYIILGCTGTNNVIKVILQCHDAGWL